MSRLYSTLQSLILVPLAIATTDASIVIDGFTPALHDRFANDPSFIGAPFDWSGVGRSAPGRWATMITDQYFLSANHARPSGTITFFPDSDPASTPVTETVALGVRILGTDLYLGMLSNPLPDSITNYAVPGLMTSDLNSFENSTYYLAEAHMVGISPTNSLGMAVGRNVLDLYAEDFDQLSPNVTDVIGYVQDPPLSPTVIDRFIPHEAYLQGGDSGGPSFLADNNNDLLLLGIHSFIGTIEGDNMEPLANLSGDSFVPNYADTIDGLMSSGSITRSDFVVAVPEPSCAIPTALLLALAVLQSRRRPPRPRRRS